VGQGACPEPRHYASASTTHVPGEELRSIAGSFRFCGAKERAAFAPKED